MKTKMSLILFFLITTSVQANYFLLKKGFLITERGTVVPAVSKMEKKYSPKFFPRDYELHFESEKSYLDFLKEASIVREKRGINCHEYILYKGEIVVHKRFNRMEQCFEKQYENYSCNLIEEKNEINASYTISYETNLIRNCLMHLTYQGERINNQTEKKDCKEVKISFRDLNYPDRRDNSSIQDLYYVTDKGLVAKIHKQPFLEDYFKKDGKFYFETKNAYNQFSSDTKVFYKREQKIIGFECIEITSINGFEKRRSVKNTLCINL